ncbi:hypothetical protein U1769_25490 [Sphingomonas sp. ZT3P38]|uniref:hypothetical protein n=1 Tax=Parasphingomonas zepuensis TaxID=3096161 RepID=UPI002FCC9BB9
MMTEGATTIHFILIAIFAAGAIAILARGRFLKRRRGRANQQHAQNNEASEAPLPPES